MSAMSPLQDQLRRQTGDASRAVEANIDRRADRPPEAGDLFVLAATAEHFVEWAILDRDPDDSGRLLAVPADTNSLAGSADVAVEGGARGALSLRCAYPVWIDAGVCQPALRTGSLEPEALERARRKHGRVARGDAGGSVLEREVDGEAEYLEWTDVLEQARAAVDRAGAPAVAGSAPASAGQPDDEPDAGPETGKVVPFPSRWGTASGLLALAASVLLVVSLGLGRRLATSSAEHRETVAEQRAELERLEQERQELEETHARELARLDGDRQTRELEQQRRIAELEASARPGARVNLPLLILAAGQLRGSADTLEVAPDADSLLLILGVDAPEAHDRYRLEIRDAGGRTVWRDDRLKPSRLSELSVLLPRDLVPDGRYQLRLHGLGGGGSEQLMERILTVQEKH